MNKLSGFKTHLTAVLAILTAVVAYANGEATLAQAIQLAFTGALASFLRAGVAKS